MLLDLLEDIGYCIWLGQVTANANLIRLTEVIVKSARDVRNTISVTREVTPNIVADILACS